ncbi:hypothetical protein [Absidia glauca]|uniref:Uncharacterized protein n=1 Tax=Absidia glauca TaxID=4829 RepID=A0A163JMV5_ABSGL|nr:hypothetical protein [Absidia glauca]
MSHCPACNSIVNLLTHYSSCPGMQRFRQEPISWYETPTIATQAVSSTASSPVDIDFMSYGDDDLSIEDSPSPIPSATALFEYGRPLPTLNDEEVTVLRLLQVKSSVRLSKSGYTQVVGVMNKHLQSKGKTHRCE